MNQNPLRNASLLLSLFALIGNSEAAKLVGYASMPADTFMTAPASGAWNNGLRGTPQFDKQPVQGLSGVQNHTDGTYWFLSDNGFGTKTNSADYLLRLYRMSMDPRTQKGGKGEVKVLEYKQLSDPYRKVPFAIINENTSERLLTGADFDPEGFIIDNDGSIWIGDEFGPYLLHFDKDGRLIEAPYSVPNLPFKTLKGDRPIITGHRGSSGTRPEHTLESYQVAIESGADFIEPDLVITKDGVLVARHEPIIALVDEKGQVKEATVDIASHPEFKDRIRIKKLDGISIQGYWVEDFTLAELKTLRALERMPHLRGKAYDGRFEIPTLSEIITLVKRYETETGKKIGIYPETKHPTYMKELGFNTSQLLVDTLVKEDFTDPSRVYIQSFEVDNLKELRHSIMPKAGVNLPLVQLVSSQDEPAYDLLKKGDKTTPQDMLSDAGLNNMAQYASVVAPYKRWIVDDNGNATNLISRAHQQGLKVHTWTFRNEPTYLLPKYLNNPEAEIVQFVNLGLDGFFTDFPATGATVVNKMTQPVKSPQHPDFSLGALNTSTIPASGGFEGLTRAKSDNTIYGLLEKTVYGDEAGHLRLLSFKNGSWNMEGYYPLEKGGEAIGDITAVNDHEIIVIERDNKQDTAAQFKRLYKINLHEKDNEGRFKKEMIADLLNINDPYNLSPDSESGILRFPYFTIENVLVLDNKTLLVANDNNYPAKGGRGKDIKDKSEFLLIQLDKPLNIK